MGAARLSRRAATTIALAMLVGGCARPAAQVPAPPAQDHIWAYDLQVHMPLSDSKFGTSGELERFQAVEDELMPVMDSVGGILDGNDIGAGEYTVNLMADDVGSARTAIREALADDDLPAGSTLVVYRWGADGDEGDPLSTDPVGRAA